MSAQRRRDTKAESALRAERLKEATEWFYQSKNASIREAARLFNVTQLTLQRYISASQQATATHNHNCKLTDAEEVAVCRYIDRLDYVNLVVQPRHIAACASRLLLARRSTLEKGDFKPLNAQWATRFIKRHGYQEGRRSAISADRSATKDIERVTKYFLLLKEQLDKGFLPNNIWNMDETGFRLGVRANDIVITKRSRAYKHHISMPENRESATSIEAVSAAGDSIPACLIMTGQLQLARWYEQKELHDHTAIDISETGFTNDEIAFRWIQHFDRHTKSRTVGTQRLLIIDGHGSHHTTEVIEYCDANGIVLFGMPPHLTHILQPLDVAVFQPLKHYQAVAVDNLTRSGTGEIIKLEFFGYIEGIRQEAFKPKTIQSTFKKAEIWPYSPLPVMQKLQERLPRTPTPPTTGSSSAGTPVTYRQTHKLSAKVKRSLQEAPIPRAVQRDIERLVKVAVTTSAEVIQVKIDLANTKHAQAVRKERRASRNKQLQNGGVLTVEDGRAMVRKRKEDDEELLRKKLNKIVKKKETARKKAEKAVEMAEKKRLREAKAAEKAQKKHLLHTLQSTLRRAIESNLNFDVEAIQCQKTS